MSKLESRETGAPVEAVEETIVSFDRESEAEGIEAGVLYREMDIELRVDKESRTLELILSSEYPVDRWFGKEILDHSPKSIRLDRLKRGLAPMLFNHNTDLHIGALSDPKFLEENGLKMLGVLGTFGRSQLAQEKWIDATEDPIILKGVSVGYRIYKMKRKKPEDSGDDDPLGVDDEKTDKEKKPTEYRAVDWEPIEGSLVPAGADIHSTIKGKARAGRLEFERGFGEMVPIEIIDEEPHTERTRSEIPTSEPTEELELQVDDEREPVEENERMSDKVLTTAERDQAVKDERERIATIGALGRKHSKTDLADTFIGDGRRLDEFRAVLLEEIGEKSERGGPIETIPDHTLHMDRKEIEEWSILRAIRGVMSNKRETVCPREYEASEAVAKKLGRETEGLLVPLDIQSGVSWVDPRRERLRQQRVAAMYPALVGSQTRDWTTTDAEGGYSVGTDVVGFIEALRAKMVGAMLGARFLSGLQGDADLPKPGAGTTYWVAEGGDITDDGGAWGVLALRAKTVGCRIPITRRLLNQTSLDVEGLAKDDITTSVAVEVDKASIQYDGTSNKPTGILNTTGIGAETFAGLGNPTWAETLNVWEEVAKDNALLGSLAWVTTSAVAKNMMQRDKGTDTGKFVWNEETNRIMTYPAIASEQMLANNIVFGNWTELVIGEWGVFELTVDSSSGSASGTKYITGLMDLDVGVRHPESFAKGSGGT